MKTRSKRNIVRSIGYPIVLTTSFLACRGCSDAIHPEFDNPLRNAPVMREYNDACLVNRALSVFKEQVKTGPGAIHPGTYNQLKNGDDHKGEHGDYAPEVTDDEPMSGLRKNTLSKIEEMAESVTGMQTYAQNEIVRLKEDPTLIAYNQWNTEHSMQALKRFGGYALACAVTMCGLVLASKRFDREEGIYRD